MSSWSTCAAHSSNPDKEAMMAARRALRDEAIATVKQFDNAEDPSDPRVIALKVRCSNLRHACAKYLIFTSWMRNNVGGSLAFEMFPDTKEEAAAAVESLERKRKEDLKTTRWAWLHEGYEYKHYGSMTNRAEWWDKVCCQ